ncbi:MAG TPA: hypothetical protein P5048_01230 [Chlamydiales bacterium]|nr:hypothetical protein [Chlamydiales bacterium]
MWNYLNHLATNKLFYLSFCFLLCFSCYKVEDTIQPQITHHFNEYDIQSLASAFPKLSEEDKNSNWGKEYLIGLGFASDLDLYRAITTFKRAKYLLSSDEEDKIVRTDYLILLCYYFAKKYGDVIQTFNDSELAFVDKTFPPFSDLLIILHESYMQLKDEKNSEKTLHLIGKHYPEHFEKISLSNSCAKGEFQKMEQFATKPQEKEMVTSLKTHYESNKKSIGKAQALNALIPGSGYLYLGQKRSAVTSFLLNGLSIAAAYQFYNRGYIAAGIITTSFEMGWYFGGIYGAGQEAKFYNERLYEGIAEKNMHKEKMFPIYLLKYAF